MIYNKIRLKIIISRTLKRNDSSIHCDLCEDWILSKEEFELNRKPSGSALGVFPKSYLCIVLIINNELIHEHLGLGSTNLYIIPNNNDVKIYLEIHLKIH